MAVVSVVVPTCRRLPLLRRAVESVFNQTFQHWELLISDDEEPAGETWAYLTELARQDPRVRVMQNPAPHGQVPNMNTLLRAARGEWVKPLHDDDVLRPRCLEVLVAAVHGRDEVALVSCKAARCVNGKVVHEPALPAGSLLTRIPQRYTHLAMYLQDESGGGVPTQLMARRSAVEQGGAWEVPPGIRTTVDSVWTMKLCRFGDAVIVNVPLVEWHQGEHESVTSAVIDAELDAELRTLRRLQREHIPPELNPPSLAVIDQMLRLIRAMHRAKRRKFGSALKLAAGCWHPQAWRLAMEWASRQSGRRPISRIPKEDLPDGLVRELLGLDAVSEPAPLLAPVAGETAAGAAAG